jgi:hypothetical protein
MVQTVAATRKPAVDPQPKAVETNPVIQLLPYKVLTKLQEFFFLSTID